MISNRCLEDFDRDAAAFKERLIMDLDLKIERRRQDVFWNLWNECGIIVRGLIDECPTNDALYGYRTAPFIKYYPKKTLF